MSNQGQIEAEIKARASLGRLLERTRRERKMQRNEVAKLIGVSNSVLSDVENGDCWPTDMIWEELTRLYGLPISMMEGMKRTAASGPREIPMQPAVKVQVEHRSNVIDFDKYRKHPWQSTTTSSPD